MPDKFRKIGLIGRSRHHSALETVQSLVQLLEERGLDISIEKRLSKLLGEASAHIISRDDIGADCDLVIVVGGDGSMLSAARAMSRHNVPVLGVNRGRLGFLTDISPEDIEARVGAVLDGDYARERRFLLDVEVTRGGNIIGRADALNDVVVNSGTSARMIEFDLFIDDTFVYRQRADGLIIATPTGSTAYALSGGGPIMHPALDAIVVVPMFPQTLSSRPIVVDGNSRIRLDIPQETRIHPPVTCDGQVNITAHPGDSVHIHKKPEELILIHPPGHSFYASCRDKLRWGHSLVN